MHMTIFGVAGNQNLCLVRSVWHACQILRSANRFGVQWTMTKGAFCFSTTRESFTNPTTLLVGGSRPLRLIPQIPTNLSRLLRLIPQIFEDCESTTRTNSPKVATTHPRTTTRPLSRWMCGEFWRVRCGSDTLYFLPIMS